MNKLIQLLIYDQHSNVVDDPATDLYFDSTLSTESNKDSFEGILSLLKNSPFSGMASEIIEKQWNDKFAAEQEIIWGLTIGIAVQ